MIAPTMPRSYTPVKETRRECEPRSAKLRVADLRADAAVRIAEHWFPRARCTYARTGVVTAKKLSVARKTGGDIGGVIELMYANPTKALEIAHYLLGVARTLVARETADLNAILRAEQRDDSAEDVSQADVMDEPTPENLRKYIADADRAIAALQRARDAAQKTLDEQ